MKRGGLAIFLLALVCAVVAGERNPSNVPVRVSCLPASTAVSEPDPAMVDIIVTSMGTGDSRALNVSPV